MIPEPPTPGRLSLSMLAVLIVLAILLLLFVALAAGTDLSCVTVWQDFFALPEMQPMYQGSNVYVEVRVQDCKVWNGRRINIEKRYYQEFSEGNKLKQEQLRDWSVSSVDNVYVIPPFSVHDNIHTEGKATSTPPDCERGGCGP